jgi:uncharacterized DUF497 family protein
VLGAGAAAAGNCVGDGQEEVGYAWSVPLLLQDSNSRLQSEPRFLALGQTNTGRRLFIAFTVRNKNIRVISARDMGQKERNLYDQPNS